MSGVARIQTSPNLLPPRFDIPLPDFDDPPVPASARERHPEPRLIRCSTLQDFQPIPVIPSRAKISHISVDTLNKIIARAYSGHFDNFVIIDCRFKYEYEGGHIKGAININSPVELKEQFFLKIKPRTLLVFHCEFSQVRGPELANFFRNLDRKMNEKAYPKLFYPYVYILQGGYNMFYSLSPDQCEGGYTKMFTSEAKESGELARATSQFKQKLEAESTEFGRRRALSDEPCRHATQFMFDPMSPKKYRQRRDTTG
jgi:M-phase inducer tyrosine phosphatase